MKANPFQFLELPRRMPRELPAPLRVMGWQEIYGGFSAPEAADQSGRCLDCGNPYCEWKCPVHNYIPNWLALVKEGRLFEAAELAHETNPLPEICGRVCPQDRLCEGDCTLNAGFDAVTIGAVEKYIVDEAFRQGWRPDLSHVVASGKRVAIIGAGPAGLSCADRLARAGIEPHVFDRYEEIGGLLSFGIPAFKLEKHVIETRRGVLEAMGVRFHLGVEVDAAMGHALMRDYDAVFLGTGAYTAVDGKLPGQDLPGVLPALPFLVANARRLLGKPHRDDPAFDLAGKRVLVLGGGDTAMDCARAALRDGASSVAIAYRGTAEKLRANPHERVAAIEEGVSFLFEHTPVAVEGEAAVRSAIFKVGAGDTAISQSIPCDAVILAFGQQPAAPCWLEAAGVATEYGAIKVDAHGRTTHPRIFAGGDAVHGADLIVTAAAAGRRAARTVLAEQRLAGWKTWRAWQRAPQPLMTTRLAT